MKGSSRLVREKGWALTFERDRGRLVFVDGFPMGALVEREVGLMDDDGESLRDRRVVTKTDDAGTGVIFEKMSSGVEVLGLH